MRPPPYNRLSKRQPFLNIALLILSTLNESTSTQLDSMETLSNERCYCCSQRCQLLNNATLECAGISKFSDDYLDACSRIVVNLRVIDARFKTMGQSNLANKPMPNLTRFTLTTSSIERIETLPNLNGLTEIEVTNNANLTLINWHIFNEVPNLKRLNLSYNKFEGYAISDSFRNLSSLDLSGNEWSCHAGFNWIEDLHNRQVLKNGDSLTCWDEVNRDSWLPWKYSIIQHEQRKRIVNAECQQRTASCSCQFRSGGKEGRAGYTVQVDCSRQNLTALPEQLPNFTDELDVSYNRITSLDQVNEYKERTLRILIADSNQIQSVRNLSNSFFIKNYSRFSLQHNFISPYEIPLQELTQGADSFRLKYLYLYNNSWDCDCSMATNVRKWLWDNRNIVNDSSLLMCSWKGKKIPVLHLLPETDVCPNLIDNSNGRIQQQEKIKTLHIVIILEVVLIVTVALKLAYDSWRYLWHGKLPWIATKLP